MFTGEEEEISEKQQHYDTTVWVPKCIFGQGTPTSSCDNNTIPCQVVGLTPAGQSMDGVDQGEIYLQTNLCLQVGAGLTEKLTCSRVLELRNINAISYFFFYPGT